jgi:dienelactone hydrolase
MHRFRLGLLLIAVVIGSSSPAQPQAGPAPPTQVRTLPLSLDYHAPAAEAPRRNVALLVLGGSEGGLRFSTGNARDLAAQGYPAVAVAYFGMPGLPSFLEEVPLETFSRAIDWIEANVTPRPTKIVIMGLSRGAEGALLAATIDRRIEGVVLFSPVHAVNQSYRWDGQQRALSAWTREGRGLPYVPTLQGQYADSATQFRESYARHGDLAAQRIPAERVNGPILMFASDADRVCPCADWADRIAADLRARSFPHPVTVQHYPASSHLLMGTGDAPTEIRQGDFVLHFGGTAVGTRAARNDAWARTLAFLARLDAEAARR